jgi:hypothetical protein
MTAEFHSDQSVPDSSPNTAAYREMLGDLLHHCRLHLPRQSRFDFRYTENKFVYSKIDTRRERWLKDQLPQGLRPEQFDPSSSLQVCRQVDWRVLRGIDMLRRRRYSVDLTVLPMSTQRLAEEYNFHLDIGADRVCMLDSKFLAEGRRYPIASREATLHDLDIFNTLLADYLKHTYDPPPLDDED